MEALLGLVVTYNVGMHIFFWRYIQDVEAEQASNRTMIKENHGLIREIRNHYFGVDDDRTNGGFISDFEEEFETIHARLDEAEERRLEEHEQVRESLNELVQAIAEEDSVEDITISDLES